jgi:hypothetical protein
MAGKGRQRMDLSGQRFGRLTPEDFFIKEYSSGIRKTIWNCMCDCGNSTQVTTSDLRSGHSQSCGCLKNEVTTKRNYKHGHSKGENPEYTSWQSAKDRCFNLNCPHYDNYGGRGISMSSEWVNNFENFYSDMGKRPEGMTLERLDVNGDYSPDNCIWADYFTQAQNRRMNSLNSTGKTGVSWVKVLINMKHILVLRVNMCV